MLDNVPREQQFDLMFHFIFFLQMRDFIWSGIGRCGVVLEWNGMITTLGGGSSVGSLNKSCTVPKPVKSPLMVFEQAARKYTYNCLQWS